MMRAMYQWMLRLHPERFRRRFEDEMMFIYDETPGAKGILWLMLDGVGSVFRQWILRPQHWRGDSRHEAVVPVSGGVPRFVCLENSGVRVATMAAGGVLTVTFFVGLSFIATLGSQPVKDPWIQFPRERWMDWNAGETGFLSAFVKVGLRSNSAPIRSATPVERRIFEWLQAYNAGDLQRAKAFYRFNAKHSPYDPSDVERELRLWKKTSLSTGQLDLVSLNEYSKYSLAAGCEDSHGTFWKIHLIVQPSYPNQVVLLQMGDHVLLDARTN